MSLQEFRKDIDRIDSEIVRLFAERMRCSADIAAYKQANGIPVYDPQREKEKLQAIIASAPEEIRDYMPQLYAAIFDASRAYQHKLMGTENAVVGGPGGEVTT